MYIGSSLLGLHGSASSAGANSAHLLGLAGEEAGSLREPWDFQLALINICVCLGKHLFTTAPYCAPPQTSQESRSEELISD